MHLNHCFPMDSISIMYYTCSCTKVKSIQFFFHVYTYSTYIKCNISGNSVLVVCYAYNETIHLLKSSTLVLHWWYAQFSRSVPAARDVYNGLNLPIWSGITNMVEVHLANLQGQNNVHLHKCFRPFEIQFFNYMHVYIMHMYTHELTPSTSRYRSTF